MMYGLCLGVETPPCHRRKVTRPHRSEPLKYVTVIVKYSTKLVQDSSSEIRAESEPQSRMVVLLSPLILPAGSSSPLKILLRVAISSSGRSRDPTLPSGWVLLDPHAR
jgi:hypothetical protein